MFNGLKDLAIEIDTKIGTLRKKVTTLAIGYVQEDASKQYSVREKLEAASETLRHCTADCDSLVEQTKTLYEQLTEADKAADEIYDSLLELYHAQGVEVPPIELDTLSVGFPIHLLPGQSVEEDKLSECDSQPEESQVFIHRPPGEEGLAPETPMIKSRKRLF